MTNQKRRELEITMRSIDRAVENLREQKRFAEMAGSHYDASVCLRKIAHQLRRKDTIRRMLAGARHA